MKTKLLLLTFATLAAFADMVGAAEAVFVTLKTRATVASTQIRLGDIADVVSSDSSLAQRVTALRVRSMSAGSETLHLSREEIEAAIAKLDQRLAAKLEWGSNGSVLVSPAPREFRIDDAVDQAGAWIAERVSQAGEFEISLKSDPAPVNAIADSVTGRPDLRGMQRVGTEIRVPIKILVDGVERGERIAVYEVVRRETPAATSRRGSPATDAQPEKSRSRLDPSVAPQGFATNSPQPASPAKGPAQGYVVSKDGPVRIVFDDGHLRIESDGIALANAGVGEPVKVRRVRDEIVLEGKATGPNMVLING